MENIYDKHGNWLFIAPVSGLTLTDTVSKEFRVNRVVFVERNKLRKIRKRLGISSQVSELKRRKFFGGSFDEAETFAVLWHSGKPAELKTKCLRLINDELSILALSQLGYGKRRYNAHPVLKGSRSFGIVEELFICREDKSLLFNRQLGGKLNHLVLDKRWKEFQKKFLFLNLLKIINKHTHVSESWRSDLERAAILIGQSLCSDDIAQGFLWNVIALELLLTEQGDKYTDVLPKRMQAFLGWVSHWKAAGYEKRINEIYRKRCEFVHDGSRESITIQDLLFTDDILFNLLVNLVNHISLFKTKKNVVEFSKRVEAENLLCLKSRVRPKTLKFISKRYSQKDFEEI